MSGIGNSSPYKCDPVIHGGDPTVIHVTRSPSVSAQSWKERMDRSSIISTLGSDSESSFSRIDSSSFGLSSSLNQRLSISTADVRLTSIIEGQPTVFFGQTLSASATSSASAKTILEQMERELLIIIESNTDLLKAFEDPNTFALLGRSLKQRPDMVMKAIRRIKTENLAEINKQEKERLQKELENRAAFEAARDEAYNNLIKRALNYITNNREDCQKIEKSKLKNSSDFIKGEQAAIAEYVKICKKDLETGKRVDFPTTVNPFLLKSMLPISIIQCTQYLQNQAKRHAALRVPMTREEYRKKIENKRIVKPAEKLEGKGAIEDEKGNKKTEKKVVKKGIFDRVSALHSKYRQKLEKRRFDKALDACVNAINERNLMQIEDEQASDILVEKQLGRECMQLIDYTAHCENATAMAACASTPLISHSGNAPENCYLEQSLWPFCAKRINEILSAIRLFEFRDEVTIKDKKKIDLYWARQEGILPDDIEDIQSSFVLKKDVLTIKCKLPALLMKDTQELAKHKINIEKLYQDYVGIQIKVNVVFKAIKH